MNFWGGIMKNIDNEILIIDKLICKNIEMFDDSDRGLLSQNILSQLRNLVELISLKAYNHEKGKNLKFWSRNFKNR